MKKFFLSLVMVVLVSEVTWAQAAGRSQATPAAAQKWRRNTAVILFSGIGGGLLGLSTLSFYGDPKEHTGNINLGALLGVLGGVGYVIYENSPRKALPRRRYDYFGMFPGDAHRVQKVALGPSVNFEFTF